MDIILKKQWFVQTREGKIDQFYDVDAKKVLGSGTYGSVIKAKIRGTKTQRAIKIIPKGKVKDPERLKREIDILRNLDHPNIIKLYETFEDNRNLYLVMELCEGGELFDRIMDLGHFSEQDAKSIFRQIMLAINYCHSNGICHRDLKPENLIFLNKDPASPIKVIDFGVSCIFENNPVKKLDKKIMSTKTGTPYYMSPEVLEGKYDEMCDIWSMGVILYILMSGVPPFNGENDPEILEAVKKGVITFDIPEFDGVSTQCKDLIRKMIAPIQNRIPATEVLKHKWITEDSNYNQQLSVNYESLNAFTAFNKLKKVTLTIMASQLSEAEIQELSRQFKLLDKNNDGVLTIEELFQGLKGLQGKKIQDIQQVIKSVDTDGSGYINYTEFLAATIEKNLYMSQEKLYHAFKMFDIDESGKISKDELQEVLGKNDTYKNVQQSFWDNLIKEADKNGDGEIDYDEFIAMMDKIKL